MVKLKINREPGFEDIPFPKYHSQGASGIDLPAAITESIVIEPKKSLMVSTGLRMEIPMGCEGQVRPRSGLAAKHGIGIVNAPGTIDSDYRGIIKVILYNYSEKPFTIERGARIAQLVICPVVRPEIIYVDEINDTKRGDGGFGHTGL